MKQKETKLFNPVRVRRTGRFKGFLTGFIAFILAFAIAGGFYIYKNGTSGASSLIKKAGGIFESDNTDNDKPQTYKNVTENFLVMSISSAVTQETGEKEIYFIAIAHADAGTGQIKFCPIIPKKSYVDLYESGGPDAVTKAVAAEYKIKMDKYIASNENTFAIAVNYMGGLEYNVPERIEYRTPDLTLILTPGRQTIKGEVLVKYFKYFKNIGLSKQGDLLCLMIDQYFTYGNFETAMSIYKGVLSGLSGNSNISFVEAADNLKYVKTVIENQKVKALTVSSVEEF